MSILRRIHQNPFLCLNIFGKLIQHFWNVISMTSEAKMEAKVVHPTKC